MLVPRGHSNVLRYVYFVVNAHLQNTVMSQVSF